MPYFKKMLAAAAMMFLFFKNTSAQSVPDSVVKKIDGIFAQWNKPFSPGFVVGVVVGDSLIFSKGYGLANLEYTIPIKPNTIFHMASVSKQFTGFAIVLLARQGKLRLDDDFRKYLPWFPDLKQKITIRNLLNHTSGIRDQWQLLSIQGTRLDDVITQRHIVKILSKQRALNFLPGDEYSYSNSNYTLLAEIVEAVSHQSLRKFTDSAIFKKLGMSNTHFHDNYEEIVPNRAYSYERIDSAHFSNNVLSYSNVGATSLFTTANDMSKWVMNFYNHKVGDQQDIDTLTKNGILNSGKKIDYALGISSGKYKSYKEFSHSGGDAGFRTFVDVFPDLKTGFIVFSNLGDVNPYGKAHEVANIFLKDTTKQSAKADDKKRDTVPEGLVKNYVGSYISDEGIELKMEIKENKLYYVVGSDSYLLVKDSPMLYSMSDASDVKFKFSGPDILVTAPDQSFRLKKYKETVLNDDSLQSYVGTYYCPELDCNYYIELKDHQLFLTNNKYNDAPLRLAGTDHLVCDFWWMNHLMIRRDKQKKITGFEVNSGRVMHVAFDKVK